jgi:D-arabinose 1-dehydrogenase-like Zn-dependent alcohol dehydrogenase
MAKAGGVIVSYGMTLGPQTPFLMGAVLKNIEFRGSTMGSRKEFADMIEFVATKHIKPVISRVVQGLDVDAIDGLFEDMKKGSQFGKLAIEVSKGGSSRL